MREKAYYTPDKLSKHTYNEIGQLKDKEVHSTNGSPFLNKTSYTYNPRGWLKSQTNTGVSFNMTLSYEDGSSPQYNGNIANQYWGPSSNPQLHNYTYLYDKLNRLTSGSSDENFNETLSYDVMGNISSLTRNPMGTNTYSYTGNQLSSISGALNSSYVYDANGNQTSDSQKGINISYNYLNLPQTISKASTSESMQNTWLSNGAKIRKTVGSLIRDYAGGIEYNNSSIEFIQTEEGRAIPSGSSYSYEYMIKDHLGNTRALLKQDGSILETNDYYPFGLQISRTGQTVPSPENRYKYNGKELQTELGLMQYDYGARFYDPVIGRWNVVDPLSEISRRWSPYVYVVNNPIRNIDPDGMTDYYSLGGKLVKHVDDGSTDKLLVLSDSKKASAIDKAIAGGAVAAVPSNEVISQMDQAYSLTEKTGNEHGFVVATDGSTSSMKEGGSASVGLGTKYEELSNNGKTSSYDVHTHPNGKDKSGDIVDVGAPTPSGLNGKKGDVQTYGKDGPNDKPSVVLGYSVEKTTNQIGGQTTTTVTKQVGFYNSNGQVGPSIDYNQLKRAVKKINEQ